MTSIVAGAGLVATITVATATGGKDTSSRAEPTQPVSFAGYENDVPASWPVYDLSADPTRCVRFDQHAVYLGTPGRDQQCPAHAVGHTEALLVEPVDSGAEETQTSEPGVLEATLPDAQVKVTATYVTDQALATSLLTVRSHPARDARRTPTATLSTTPSPTASATADPTGTATPAPSDTSSPSDSPSPSDTPTGSDTPTPDSSATESPTASQTATPAPSDSTAPTASDSPTPTTSETPTVTPSDSPTSSTSATSSPDPTTTPTPTPSPSPTASPTPTPTPSPTATPPPSPSPSPFTGVPSALLTTGYGFDTCDAPSLDAMTAWSSTTMDSVGIYIGGINRACGTQTNLTATWVQSVRGLGYSFIPTYVGLQAPCSSTTSVKIDPKQAGTQGTTDANDAATAAQALGFGHGNPVYLDMEAYSSTDSTCITAMLTYTSTWVQRMHALGYATGFYSSAASGAKDLASVYNSTTYTVPDALWFVRWNDVADLDSSPYVSNSLWVGRRIHQYTANVTETHGGSTIRIDKDYLQGPIALPGSF